MKTVNNTPEMKKIGFHNLKPKKQTNPPMTIEIPNIAHLLLRMKVQKASVGQAVDE